MTAPVLSSLAGFRRVQPHSFEDERLEGGLVYRGSFVEIDGANRLAVQAGIEELLGILHLGALGEGQPDGVLEAICDAQDSIMRPNGDTLWPGGFFPLH